MEHRQPGPRVFTVDGVLGPHACDALIRITESEGYVDAPINSMTGFVMIPEVRNNTRVILDNHDRARRLWERVQRWIPAQHRGRDVVGLNERFRFYRYRPGQYFQWHRDGAFHRNSEQSSALTLMIYLNEGFEGGDTEFDQYPSVRPRQGTMLVFDHGLRHRGAPVVAGTKYVLRTDVMFRWPVARVG